MSGSAANALAFLFENGQGVAKDVKQSVFWYTQAADANFAMAQGNLGRLYNTGTAFKKDPVQAYMWLKLATFQNDPMGQHILSEALSGDTFTAQEKAEGDRLADEFRAKHNLPPLSRLRPPRRPRTGLPPPLPQPWPRLLRPSQRPLLRRRGL